jgi:hypothetical protein
MLRSDMHRPLSYRKVSRYYESETLNPGQLIMNADIGRDSSA